MNDITIVNLACLNDGYKEKSMELFIDGFGHIFSFIKDRNILKELLLTSMDFSMVYVALYENIVIGFVAISDNKIRPISFKIEKFKQLFGSVLGTIIQKPLSAAMEKPAVYGDKDLYIDYLVIDKKHRSKGIGAKLIGFVCEELEFDECYIEVLSKNTDARRLYEYLGFTEFKKEYNPSTIIRGLGYLIKFNKRIR